MSQAVVAADAPLSYRKLQNGTWVDFDLGKVASGGLNAFGACSSNSGDYTAGLNAGDRCLMLTLTDGSLAGGDADGAADGSISDPGGVATGAASDDTAAPPSRGFFDGGSGCTINTVDSVSGKADWWLVAGFLALLGWMRRNRSMV